MGFSVDKGSSQAMLDRENKSPVAQSTPVIVLKIEKVYIDLRSLRIRLISETESPWCYDQCGHTVTRYHEENVL